MKVRYGKATIHQTCDTEIPDDAYDFAFMGAGEDEAYILYMLPTNPDDAMKAKVNELMHHLHGHAQTGGGYK